MQAIGHAFYLLCTRLPVAGGIMTQLPYRRRSTSNRRRSIPNRRRFTLNRRRSTSNRMHFTLNRMHSASNRMYSAPNRRRSTPNRRRFAAVGGHKTRPQGAFALLRTCFTFAATWRAGYVLGRVNSRLLISLYSADLSPNAARTYFLTSNAISTRPERGA